MNDLHHRAGAAYRAFNVRNHRNNAESDAMAEKLEALCRKVFKTPIKSLSDLESVARYMIETEDLEYPHDVVWKTVLTFARKRS